MKIMLYGEGGRLESFLKEPLLRGFRSNGDVPEFFMGREDPEGPEDVDLAVFVGVKYHNVYKAYRAAGRQTLLVDKGYFSRLLSTPTAVMPEKYRYWKLALNGFHSEFLRELPPDSTRLKSVFRLSPNFSKGRNPGRAVIFVGSSDKYHLWHDLPSPQDYAIDICRQLKKITDRPIIYRPKPTWWRTNRVHGSPPGTKVVVDGRPFSYLLMDCHCVVTHGSNGAAEAALAGVPVITTDPTREACVVDELCEHDLKNIEAPYVPSPETRRRVLSQIAWGTFSIEEIASGYAWFEIKKWMRPL